MKIFMLLNQQYIIFNFLLLLFSMQVHKQNSTNYITFNYLQPNSQNLVYKYPMHQTDKVYTYRSTPFPNVIKYQPIIFNNQPYEIKLNSQSRQQEQQINKISQINNDENSPNKFPVRTSRRNKIFSQLTRRRSNQIEVKTLQKKSRRKSQNKHENTKNSKLLEKQTTQKMKKIINCSQKGVQTVSKQQFEVPSKYREQKIKLRNKYIENRQQLSLLNSLEQLLANSDKKEVQKQQVKQKQVQNRDYLLSGFLIIIVLWFSIFQMIK